MDWIKTTEQLPPVDACGESEYVLAYHGHGAVPDVVKYSDGTCSFPGWHSKIIGCRLPFYTGKGKNRRLTFTHWAKIELPKEEYKSIPYLFTTKTK